VSAAPDDERQLVMAIARLHAGVLALVGAVIGGVGLFAVTAWLVVKGGPHVGAHLQLLNQYFYGYTVSWPGSVVGFLYGAAVGAVAGWSIGAIYNLIVGLRAE